MVYKVLGLMSGTSLDGLDLAYVEFAEEEGRWVFELKQTSTVRYEDEWFADLRNAPSMVEYEINKLHKKYGEFLGRSCTKFMEEQGITPELIASHGHTIFHKPEEGLTFQLGDGQVLASTCGIETVNDFRSLDVSLGGQGAPLVPIGDKHLFSEYDICLNLGGFANLSYESGEDRIAYDISPVNIVMNVFANSMGREYDEGGKIAASGKVNVTLLKELNALNYYSQAAPKSLSREWVDSQFMPLFHQSADSDEDKLRTMSAHIAQQIQKSTANIIEQGKTKMLVTGGGALNHFLIECIKEETSLEIVVPNRPIIEFKEAVIFAFLGVLRIRNEINCLSSVTGARKDSCSGVISKP